MTRLIVILSAILAAALATGCVQTVKDVTNMAIPKYTSIAARTYVTQTDLFLVNDRGRKRAYLVKRDAQYFPLDPAKFTGEEIPIAWGSKSFVTDVIGKGTSLVVDRIEYVAGFDMVYDRIYGRFLTGKHTGEIVQMESLFLQSDRSATPTLPNTDYLKEAAR